MAESETRTIQELIHEFNEIKASSEILCIYTKSARLQRKKIEELDRYVVRIKGFKAAMITAKRERDTNILFFMQCFIRSLQSILRMLVELKDDSPASAWKNLIDAMEYKDIARKADAQPCIDTIEQRLNQMRAVLFPQWSYYFSAGYTETIGDCSICGKPFLDCDHIENFVYMGRLCQRLNRIAINPDHMSLVETPRDLRCVISEIANDEGQMMNYFTGEIVENPSEESGAAANNERTIKGIVLNMKSLDFD